MVKFKNLKTYNKLVKCEEPLTQELVLGTSMQAEGDPY